MLRPHLLRQPMNEIKLLHDSSSSPSSRHILCAWRGVTKAYFVSQVDVISPAGKTLARELKLQVQAGKSLLITGPNGSGKSSLIR